MKFQFKNFTPPIKPIPVRLPFVSDNRWHTYSDAPFRSIPVRSLFQPPVARIVAKRTMSPERIREELYKPTLWTLKAKLKKPEIQKCVMPLKCKGKAMVCFTVEGKNITIQNFFQYCVKVNLFEKCSQRTSHSNAEKMCKYLICGIENAFKEEELCIKGICKLVSKKQPGVKLLDYRMLDDNILSIKEKLYDCNYDCQTIKHIHEKCVDYVKHTKAKRCTRVIKKGAKALQLIKRHVEARRCMLLQGEVEV